MMAKRKKTALFLLASMASMSVFLSVVEELMPSRMTMSGYLVNTHIPLAYRCRLLQKCKIHSLSAASPSEPGIGSNALQQGIPKKISQTHW